MGHFGPENDTGFIILGLWHKIHWYTHINGFSEKKLIQDKRVNSGQKVMCRHNSGFTIRDFVEFLHNESGQEIDWNWINGFFWKNSLQL